MITSAINLKSLPFINFDEIGLNCMFDADYAFIRESKRTGKRFIHTYHDKNEFKQVIVEEMSVPSTAFHKKFFRVI